MTPADPVRYPIGPFVLPDPVTPAHRAAWGKAVTFLPARLRLAAAGLGDAQLDTPYREGGWTLRQVVHHVADAHPVLAARIRQALAEDRPAVTPFDETAWAALPDARVLPVEPSIAVVDGVHTRLSALLETLDEAAWERAFYHAGQGRWLTVEEAVGRLAWHGDHHVGQIVGHRRRQKW